MPNRTEADVGRQIQQLSRLTIADLKIKYREVFGEKTKVLHKQFLIRRIAWKIQANDYGDLGERARRRIREIADGAEVSVSTRAAPKRIAPPTRPLLPTEPQRDTRLPPPGGFLRRQYQGREIVVKVLEEGFEWESQRYRSLSALARELTGTRWNGLLFFGLAERRHG